MARALRVSLLLLVLCCSFILFCSTRRAAAANRSAEADALLRFKAGLQDADVLLSQWRIDNADAVCATWEGVLCSRPSPPSSSASVDEDVVTGLNFTLLNLNGTLTPPLCELPHLTHLYLRYNFFAQPFPSFLLSRCPLLLYLDLSQNLFDGPLPSGISALSRLQFLSLESNLFTGPIPPSFGSLPNLTLLSLRGNSLSGTLPPQLGNLSSLQTLDLAYNPSFGPSPIPPELGNLTTLQDLVLTSCNLDGPIPPSLGNLLRLTRLDLALNNLSGFIPSSLTQLRELKYFYLWDNNLTGHIPAFIGNLSNLLELDFAQNQLQGTLPQGLVHLQQLQKLHLEVNGLEGSLPEGLSGLPNLYSIILYDNQLSGVIPQAWGEQSNLVHFDVLGNRLTGPIPPNLCRNNALEYLILAENLLEGGIPATYARCQSMVRLELNDNRLTGGVPAGLWSLRSLQLLWLQNNNLSGQILTLETQNNSQLQVLALDNNQFEGALPSTSFNYLWNLSKFTAAQNKLSGSLPSLLGKLTHLGTLNLSHNSLSGQIPPSLNGCLSLTSLDLSHNSLSGAIPSELASIPVLNSLDLSHNTLNGSIPSSVGMHNFVSFDVSYNDLSGCVPDNLARAFPGADFEGNPALAVDTNTCLLQVAAGKGGMAAGANKNAKLLLILLVILLPLAAVLCLLLVLRVCCLQRRRPLVKMATDWEVVPFQRLDFKEEEVWGRLDEKNMVGNGGSGTVHKVVVGGGRAVVAVKKLSCGGKDHWNVRCRSEKERAWAAEMKILGMIKHRNIVKLLCACTSSDFKLLVYEYIPNGSLGDVLHRRRLSSYWSNGHDGAMTNDLALNWSRRFNIAMGVAEALCYLHHDCVPPVVHRDIKSNNILLDSDFQPKLADFGVAKVFRGKSANMTDVVGSVGYIAPEYAYTWKVDEKSDVYSYGVVLLELITGKSPSDEEFLNGGMDMVRWVARQMQLKESVWDVFDPQIHASYCCLEVPKSNHHTHIVNNACSCKESMLLLLKVALHCTSAIPYKRPSMQEVVDVLRQAKLGLYSHNQKLDRERKNLTGNDSKQHDSTSVTIHL